VRGGGGELKVSLASSNALGDGEIVDLNAQAGNAVGVLVGYPNQAA
jgi:hypothetical protein